MVGIELSPSDRMMVEGLYWWDIATFFRCPIDRDPSGSDTRVEVTHTAFAYLVCLMRMSAKHDVVTTRLGERQGTRRDLRRQPQPS